MKCPASLFLLIICLKTISCQEEGGGDSPTGGHDQPPPDQSNQQNPDSSKRDKDSNGKSAGEQGYTQGFNQGVKPYSYGYNTGIKPYSYNFYQPLGGKPQVVEQGGPDGDKGDQKVTSAAGAAPQPSPPPIPAIEFPADFSAFGLSPADLAIPPPPAQAVQSGGREQNTQRRQPVVPVNFPVQPQTRAPAAAAVGQTPPPFNYADYGIPTDIGTATGSAAGSPFGILDGGVQQQQQRPLPQRGLEGDEFGIFGGGSNGNPNSGLSIPVLEDNNNQNNQNNQQQNFAIPLFGGGTQPQNQANDFNFANNDISNDFNVAASDFEPFNFQNFVPPEFARSVPLVAGPTTGDRGAGNPVPKAGTTGTRPQTTTTGSTSPNFNRRIPVPQKMTSNSLSQSSIDRKAMYQAVAPTGTKKAKRSINEQPHEKPLKDDPNSAYNILNMDPKYTNPNQGVYSYYPAYRMPS